LNGINIHANILSEEIKVSCESLSRATDFHRIPVDNCMTKMTEDQIQIVSQDGETITFMVKHDCTSAWIATDFIARNNELTCQKNEECGISKEYTASCVDGVTIVDLYTHGDHYRQTDGSSLVIPKACDETGIDAPLCHFRYVIKCYPSKCEARDRGNEKGLRGNTGNLNSVG